MSRKMRSLTAFLAFFLVAVALLSGCSRKEHYRVISLAPGGSDQPASANPVGTGKPPLRVAIAAVISPRKTLKYYATMLDYLGEQLDRPVQVIQRQTYAEVNKLIKEGAIDLAFVCTYAFVKGRAEFGMELIAAPQVNGKPYYYSYIIAPAGTDALSIMDLKGKTFAFSDPLSMTGRIVPTYLLQENGQTPERFFKKLLYTYSHDNSIKSVADRLVDGAAVDSLVYEFTVKHEPALTKQVEIIQKVGPFGTPPVVVPPGLDPALKERIRSTLLTMDRTKRGRDILADIMVERFVVPDDRLYDEVRRMAAAVKTE